MIKEIICIARSDLRLIYQFLTTSNKIWLTQKVFFAITGYCFVFSTRNYFSLGGVT